jgi:hypothetical protein
MPPAASSAPAPMSCGPTGDPVNASGVVGVVLAGLTGTVEVELADDDGVLGLVEVELADDDGVLGLVEVELADDDGLLGLVDVELADDDGDDGLECGVVGVVHGVLGWLLVPVGLE